MKSGGVQTIGIAKSQEEMDAHLATLPNGRQLGNSTWLEGDIMYADLNHDGKITTGNTVEDPADLATSVIYQNPGWPLVADQGSTQH